MGPNWYHDQLSSIRSVTPEVTSVDLSFMIGQSERPCFKENVKHA